MKSKYNFKHTWSIKVFYENSSNSSGFLLGFLNVYNFMDHCSVLINSKS